VAVHRYPVGSAIQHIGVGAPRNGRVRNRHTDRMPLRLGRLIGPDKVDHVVLPRIARRVAFVAYLENHVVQVVDCIDNCLDVSVLQGGHCRNRKRLCLCPRAVTVRITVDAIDVVRRVEGMPEPWVRTDSASLVLHAPTIEQHHRHINPSLLSTDYPWSDSREISWIDPRQIELWTAIRSNARPWALVKRRRKPAAAGFL